MNANGDIIIDAQHELGGAVPQVRGWPTMCGGRREQMPARLCFEGDRKIDAANYNRESQRLHVMRGIRAVSNGTADV